MILEEFDQSHKAIINPEDLNESIEGFPETAVSCFARETFARMLADFEHELITTTSMANIEIPIYRIFVDGRELALFNAPVGASACVAILEDMIAFGMKKLVLFGTCGILDEEIKETSVIIPTEALRDEGTSYHYAPPGDEVAYDESLLVELEAIFDKHDIEHIRTKSWTTDAFYRETPDKVKRRLAAGAQVVDMEASAIMAWSQFRKSKVYQFFYTADYVDHHNRTWDARHEERTADAMTFFTIALTIAKELER